MKQVFCGLSWNARRLWQSLPRTVFLSCRPKLRFTPYTCPIFIYNISLPRPRFIPYVCPICNRVVNADHIRQCDECKRWICRRCLAPSENYLVDMCPECLVYFSDQDDALEFGDGNDNERNQEKDGTGTGAVLGQGPRECDSTSPSMQVFLPLFCGRKGYPFSLGYEHRKELFTDIGKVGGKTLALRGDRTSASTFILEGLNFEDAH